ncbi:MAG: hypothetical protein DRP26_04410 [Candidatus Zixiibacteriota bacterium]|nr:MAG: hypothetical protein DRP26_04410 [candidate division Zixibacteria bacterium]
MDILFFLLFGHLCGDFALQTDYMASSKNKSLAMLLYHVVIYTACLWLFFIFYSLLYKPGLFFKISTLVFLGVVFIQHLLQDFIKCRINKGTKQAFYLDQIMHLLVLYIYRIFIYC